MTGDYIKLPTRYLVSEQMSTTLGWQEDREHHLRDEFLMCARHTEKSEKRSSIALYLKPFQVPLRLQAAGFFGTVHTR